MVKKCEFKGCKEKATVFTKNSARCSKHPSVIILDDNPFSIACYLDEYGDETFKDDKTSKKKAKSFVFR